MPLARVVAACVIAAVVCPPVVRGQPAPNAWRGRVELGFNGSSGNSSFSILRTGGSVTRLSTEVYEFEISTLVRYGKSEERTIANDQRATIKFDWHPEDEFSPFVFATASRDRIRRIDAKFNGGVGAKWTFFHRGLTKISYSLAGIIDYEDFRLDAGSAEQETRSVGRWSHRLKFDHEFGSGASFGHITFWQPEVTDFGDYLVEIENSLTTRLLSNLNLVIQHEYLHDEVPPPGIEPDDQRFSVVLRVML